MLKKLSAILLTVGLFMQTEITVLASEIDVESIITVEDNENIETPGLGYIEPEEYDASSVCWENKYQLLGSSPQVAQSYYKTELLPEIRHQGSYGTCWAFATLGCMEINLMKKGYTDVDLSELHLAYFTYHSATDPLGGLQGDEYSYANTTTSFLQIGGNEVYASNALMDWLGAASEKTVPYSQAATVAKDGLADELAFEDVAHLQGVRKINMSDTGDVKQAIVEYGAVQISYHAISSYNSNAYYNADTAGYYCYDENGTNHAVIIVGWDDNYAASKFPTQPSGNGAWIVRNSWGSGYGEGGYFYLSYYDKSLSDVAVAFEAEMSDNYDNNYQYDGSPIVGYLSYAPVKLANVFQAKANEGGLELLEAVSFQTMNANCNYTINIYKNLTDMGNPESGLLCDTMSGQTTYEGIYTIPLNEEVYLEQNAYYSVVIDLTSENEDKLKIPLDMADTNNLYNASSVAKEQQSFWWYYGSWQDFGKQYGGNLKIKAYTTNADIQETIFVTGISLYPIVADINVGQTLELSVVVTPENATHKELVWSSSDENIAIVDENGLVEAKKVGTATITAKATDGSNVTTCCQVNVKQPMTGIELNKTAVEINMNGSEQLTVTYLPTDTTDDKTVTWKSMDETVATVTQNGLIKPVAPGTATIVATVGEFTARAEVKIKPVLVTGLEIKTDKNTIEVGEKIQLLVNVLPVDATNKAIVWYSFDETIATVDDNGNVTGIKAGQTVISATAQGGDASKILTITVVQKTEEDDSESTKEPEDIVKPEEPGDSVDKDESGDSDTSDDKDETGDSDTPGNKDETGDSDTPGNKDEIGDSDTSVDKNETEDSNTSDNTDNQTGSGTPVLDGMVTESDGKRYWYEDGIKQGLEGRGKEIYDSERGAWYWLDSVLDGAVATSKDVYQESAAGEWADNADGTGKWVRYDENGHMIKGWQTTENGTYYFDKIYGTMAKGSVVIDGIPCYFDPNTGIAANGQWITIDGVPYWYENGVRQGLEGRGKEIYDATTNAWYWLDSVDMGKKAVSKDVYQESLSAYPDREDGTGKWVRYDENGHMVKGWQTTEQGIYYFEEITGAMAKGQVTIDGKEYNFDETTGLLK